MGPTIWPAANTVVNALMLRDRLGLSAERFGKLIGVTGQSIYAWEAGRSVPRAKQLEAIAALRGIGKKEVRARLAAGG